MKKTEYFISQVAWNQTEVGLTQVTKKRDDFIRLNEIAKIDDEDIKLHKNGNNQTVFVIKLTYYLK
ncbi:hypothetical protein A5M85_09055 [Cellulophaga lytica]|uniref:hypothetical protein n=1 Tax=Cellulophaga lytica TaxID=979 RepID=UPI00095089F0|nr:hypothetical protein [Cellulophaga lytica]APU10425.1 hypothetical protein A5M85_09055 [Cellulophaga lytica]